MHTVAFSKSGGDALFHAALDEGSTMIELSEPDNPHTLEIVQEPTQNDILCGKDKYCLRHPGSRRFREVVESYQGRYREASTKSDKMKINKEILAYMSSTSARFLKFNSQANGWEELTILAARDKVSHALRNLRCRKKQKNMSTEFAGLSRSARVNESYVEKEKAVSDSTQSFQTQLNAGPSGTTTSDFTPLPFNSSQAEPLTGDQSLGELDEFWKDFPV